MPMDFPDSALRFTASVWGFRAQATDESNDDYRRALALHVLPKDRIEACEIRFGHGLDKFTADETIKMWKGDLS